MLTRLLTVLGLVVLSAASSCHAENRVTIKSKVVPSGATGVVVHILLENDVPLAGCYVPLEIRSLDGGVFPVSARIAWGERMIPWPPGTWTRQFDEPDGVCGDEGRTSYVTAVAEDTLPHPITPPVSGVIFGFSMSPLGLTPVLEAGRDTSGSLRLIVDVPMTSGQFEIDTTCASLDSDPNHSLHLEFYDTGQEGPPAFDRGTITVILCDCPYQSDLDSSGSVDAVDLAGEIDVVFFGEGDPQDPDCPATRSDFNADGTPDAVDLALLIDHVFFGGSGPISPCEW